MTGEEFRSLGYGVGEKFCGRFGGCGFEFRDGGFFFGEILVVAEKSVEIVGWGFESVEAGV